jgi:hypothetical protein
MSAPEANRETEDEAPTNTTVRGVYVENLHLLFGLINDRLAAVFEANRFFEEHTGIANKAGANNLTEALSHVGTLIEKADRMSAEEQRDQVALFGDHLRRSMMESFEQVVKARLGQIKDEGLWDRYNEDAVPLLRRGKLHSAPAEEETRTLGRQTAALLSDGRDHKRAERWDDWDAGAKCLADACEKSNQLIASLRQSVGAADQYRRERRNAVVGWAGLTLGVIGLILALVLA